MTPSIRGGNINPTRQSTTRNSITNPSLSLPLSSSAQQSTKKSMLDNFWFLVNYIPTLGSREDEQQREVLLGSELRRRVKNEGNNRGFLVGVDQRSSVEWLHQLLHFSRMELSGLPFQLSQPVRSFSRRNSEFFSEFYQFWAICRSERNSFL